MSSHPVTFYASKNQQLLLRLLFWFSVYGFLVSMVLNAGFWMITGPLAHYLELAPQSRESQSVPFMILDQVQNGFWGLSAYFLLLLIGTYGALNSHKWGLVLVGILIGCTLVAIILTIGLIIYYGSSLETFPERLYWSILAILIFTGGLFAWMIYRLSRT